MRTRRQMRMERDALVDWMGDQPFTHALTLNTERELSSARMRQIFSSFCHQFDKSILGSRNVRSLPTSMRLHAIAFPENLLTNAHVHVFADLGPAISAIGNEREVLERGRCCWLESTKGAGSFHNEPDPDRGWGYYITKRYNGDFYLAADFWPH
ncbi:hypothetical protein ACLBKU_13955 [Erythrobacter sp. NE805]|uniref:hypothetical protein n=1 Tax=Erythrobacter sp. NE805 TaxID=3389875 RepID=UPI00396B1C81